MSTEPRTSHEAADDGFHEIQLNGKQLVFLGMATTLVSVVIFLCGVLVGRGVRPIEPVAEAAGMGAPVAESTVAEAAPSSTTAAQPAETPADEPTPVSEPASAEAGPDGTLEAAKAETAPAVPPPAAATKPADVPKPADTPKPTEAAKTAAAAPAPKADAKPADPTPEARPAETRVADAPPAAAAPEPARAAESKPATGGKVAVQVAALGSRSDAEAVARRLSGKGYAAYIVSPEPGGKAVFRVRVGNYASLDEAQRISSRLAQEEKLKPWIIR